MHWENKPKKQRKTPQLRDSSDLQVHFRVAQGRHRKAHGGSQLQGLVVADRKQKPITVDCYLQPLVIGSRARWFQQSVRRLAPGHSTQALYLASSTKANYQEKRRSSWVATGDTGTSIPSTTEAEAAGQRELLVDDAVGGTLHK